MSSDPRKTEAQRRACTLSLAAATMGGAVDVDATADDALGPAPLARWISLLGLAPSTAVSSLHAFSWVNQSVRCSSLQKPHACCQASPPQTSQLCLRTDTQRGARAGRANEVRMQLALR